jgi:hypothetical protein
MRKHRTLLRSVVVLTIVGLWTDAAVRSQGLGSSPTPPPLPRSLRTPLTPETLQLLANEVSGQVIYNNLVKLAGAPWIRNDREFPGVFYEAQLIHDMVRECGIATVRLEKHASPGTFDYPLEGELWLLEPQRRLVARLEADPALIATGSRTADITGELIYVPPSDTDKIKKALAAGPNEQYRGKVALMWSHPSDADAKTLAAAGLRGVIAFHSRERYFDPNQVVYSAGPYGQHDPLEVGFSISWRQWSELLEDLEFGKKIVVRGRARVEKYPHKFDTVYSWIPGTEPHGKGVILTAHLFDGYVKRGANDNMSGCVIELEILRTLQHLIATGQLPRPRRTIHFLWPQEISGTYAFFKEHPGFTDPLSVNLNLDMVGEGLRQNNAALRMYQCPGHLPSYVDGLVRSLLNYVWRTNDVVFGVDGPRGRPGGQYFPIPLVEKNGSRDAFRFSIHPTAGGTDHICFINPSVAVPGISLITWPDQWYHADTDTPDKSDPTQLKRVAFIGAACAWTAANCTDDVVGGLADVVSEYGFLRVAERELPLALARVGAAEPQKLPSETEQALRLVAFGTLREVGALRTIEGIYSGSGAAQQTVEDKVRQWELHERALRTQVLEYVQLRAAQMHVAAPPISPPDELQQKCERMTPSIAPTLKGREFNLLGGEKYNQYLKEHPAALQTLGITPAQAAAILNYVNGQRSVAQIAACVAGQLDEAVPLQGVLGDVELLASVGLVVLDAK